MSRFTHISLLILLILCVACTEQTSNPEKDNTQQQKQEQPVEVGQPVHIDPVKTGTISSYLISSGTIESNKTVEIFPKVSGYVTEVLCKEGEFVKKGQPLVKLDPREWEIVVLQARMDITELKQQQKQEKLNIETLRKKIQQAQLNISELEEQMKQVKLDQTKTKKDLDRGKESYQQNIISEGDLENNRYNYQKSLLAENSLTVQIKRSKVAKEEAELELTKANSAIQNIQVSIRKAEKVTLRDALLKLSYATITAPFSGVLIEQAVTEGQLIGTSAKIFTLVDLKKLILVLNIPERELTLLKEKQKVILRSENFPDMVAEGRVESISPVVNNQTGTVAVKVAVRPDKSILRPGIFVQASIVLQHKTSVVVIPRAPILYDNNRSFVYVVNDENKAQKKFVELGIREGDQVEVLSGVEQDEKLIVSGHHIVEDKQLVEIIEREENLESN
ncbi:efflux RND transporter periplasmic adaptor subunit [Candidatus Uabimicrobium amorphum]|uniref:Secretion protein HlyD n=1 Tax=Uabimicrobium amorphum TaxID=2596890 RepID=A0A5S9F4Q8_UABAM|nr:efflux RND transporter periplasmic adaptor subunit [Candidatus Uabimicrobium amorphum]BBM85531.1 secretion protein HlyD [Candidatus Uabimicrobium amorphum]